MSKLTKVTVATIKKKKKRGEKIVTLTAYDYYTSRMMNQAGIDLILVGDSLGMVVLGYENTVPVTMSDMLHHTRAVVRGNSRCLVVADMPFLSYQVSDEEALHNAGRFIQEAGAHAVKLEGGKGMSSLVSKMVRAGIPVLGHIGLLPQNILKDGGYIVRGKDSDSAGELLEDARALEEAGAFAVVLECIPAPVAGEITDALKIPTIGIGAGPLCDGQILVVHDLLGIFDQFQPKFVKQYADLRQIMLDAFKSYKKDVEESKFPREEHSY
ncbi:MAG: 3-methyl-2-oxobutanoate hydroxymethyltransferase [Candidatus Euphemobacter frigidus]|nr:3-methyl-2-oxobutanoate hydroxymethyltransferase [Candidatus Euphemobacter frigidus]MDP8274879.1 3-methyl-2-oxobutanoate hydroxymethyltransferase [Candidatus Euphemobacter frigidus]